MVTKEKWVELFEQVIGRKPTADEFLEGKRSDFDPKKIISIAAPAGQSNDGPAEEKQSSVTQEENWGQEEPAVEFLKEEFVEASPKEEKQVLSESDQYQEQRENWLQAFETNIGRKPTKEEFLEARNQGFLNLPIRSELLDSELPQKAIKKAEDTLYFYKQSMLAIDELRKNDTSKRITKEVYKKFKRLYTIGLIEKMKEMYIILQTEKDENIRKEIQEFFENIKKEKIYKNISGIEVKDIIKRKLLKYNMMLYLKKAVEKDKESKE